MSILEFIKILNLLSSMYLCKPTKEAIENWRVLLSESAPDFLLELKNAVDSICLNSERELEDLLWEYTRLFIGPYKLPCPPWGSVYTSPKKLMMQDAYDEVKSFYREVGLIINNHSIMPDHIGAELNFLAVLFQKINDESEKKYYYMDIIRRFLDEHLMKWVPQFVNDMKMSADSLCYKRLAEITGEMLMLSMKFNERLANGELNIR